MARQPEMAGQRDAWFCRFLRARLGIDSERARRTWLGRRLASALGCFGPRPAPGMDLEDALADAATTNYTFFFREPRHFHLLAGQLRNRMADRRRILLWSAAASSGEEPYTMAMAALEAMGPCAAARVSILATDVSRRVLARAARGIYPAAALEPLPEAWRRRHFVPTSGCRAGYYSISPIVRKMVRLRHLNLARALPVLPLFHTIFCRNVMIYFDAATRACLLSRLAAQLAPGGMLVAGHAECAMPVPPVLEYAEQSVWRARAMPGASRFGKEFHRNA